MTYRRELRYVVRVTMPGGVTRTQYVARRPELDALIASLLDRAFRFSVEAHVIGVQINEHIRR